MKLRAPMYYKDFHCIAEKCKNNCCAAGWEIDIDDKTANFYSTIAGEFGKKLQNSIISTSDGTSTKSFKLDENNNCPFWNKNHLCDICINLGEEHLCNICAEHPRFYEWFENEKEAGIGLCCEEASRIILSNTKKFSIIETEIPYDGFDEYDKDLYHYLKNNRSKIITHIDESDDFHSSIRNVLWYCFTLQKNIDSNLLDDVDIIDIKDYSNSSIIPILEFISELEPNDSSWPNYIKSCIDTYQLHQDKLGEFKKNYPEIQKYLKNIAIYFIWRYFLKGTFDSEILSKTSLMAISVAVLEELFFCKWMKEKCITLEDCIDITRKYSEEIEYSEENIIKLEDACYEKKEFNVEYLIGLF